MTPFEIVTAILNLLALILIPIIAVIIGQHLQNVSAKRKDKMDVFKTMMMNRIGWSVEGTRAMNIIDIVFSDDKNVRQAWSEYYHALCVKDPDEIQLKQMQQAQDKLLEKMAISLGYKDKITWETIQNPYVHNIFEWGEVILALVAVHAVGHSHQPHIMEREKFLGELAHLNVVATQPGEVFHKHRRDVPGLDCGDHFLKAGAFHGSAGDPVIHEKDGVRIALVFRGLLENFLLASDLSRGLFSFRDKICPHPSDNHSNLAALHNRLARQKCRPMPGG